MQLMEILIFNDTNSAFAEFDDRFKKDERVVVSTESGLELGVIKNEKVVGDKANCLIVRLATSEDNKAYCENCKRAKALVAEIKQEADKLVPDMKVSYVAINLENTKITLNYTANGRVDFRELLKVLSNKYKSKIEMRQIGDRDETMKIGAMGVCGRETCCKAFLSDFDKVSIKMAKNQKIALNPNKINGMCGRLLCCLKYEDDFYVEMQKKMPKTNSEIETPDGVGVVIDTDCLKETVTVQLKKDDSEEIKIYPLSEIEKK